MSDLLVASESTWFRVLVEAHLPDGQPGLPAGERRDELLDARADTVAGWDGAAGVGERTWSVRLSVQAGDPIAASVSGLQLAPQAAGKVGLPPWPVLRLETLTEQVLGEDNARQASKSPAPRGPPTCSASVASACTSCAPSTPLPGSGGRAAHRAAVAAYGHRELRPFLGPHPRPARDGGALDEPRMRLRQTTSLPARKENDQWTATTR